MKFKTLCAVTTALLMTIGTEAKDTSKFYAEYTSGAFPGIISPLSPAKITHNHTTTEDQVRVYFFWNWDVSRKLIDEYSLIKTDSTATYYNDNIPVEKKPDEMNMFEIYALFQKAIAEQDTTPKYVHMRFDSTHSIPLQLNYANSEGNKVTYNVLLGRPIELSDHLLIDSAQLVFENGIICAGTLRLRNYGALEGIRTKFEEEK